MTSETIGPLVPYLPRLIVDWMNNDPAATHRSVDGTLAFLDVSGFTKLSERLARKGKAGAEDLSDAIDLCFTRLLTVARDEGGSLLKFGGDALLLLFSGPLHAHRACRAACDMRRELREVGRLEVPSAGRINLRMSVGIHSGTFNLFLVGGLHREFIVTGPDATATVAMESSAQAGEIRVSTHTAAALRPGWISGEDAGGHLLRRAPTSAPIIDLRSVFPVPAPGADLLSCIPLALRPHLLAAHHEPEHRRATVAFVHFDGTDGLVRDRGAAETAVQLDELITTVQVATARHDVAFLGTDIDADGGKVILVAGAPSARGDDEERMLRAVREIADARTAIPVRIGVNRGDVFAGDIGPRTRRTYTIMGDTVNLAARLMARAQPGQILASPAVTDRCRARFELSPLEPFYVKGKAQPVQAFAVGALAAVGGIEPDGAWARTAPLIGRTAELQRLVSAIGSAARGAGGLIEIVGDAGLGKTRLLDEMRAHAAQTVEGLSEFRGACETYESLSPYSAIRPWMQMLLGVTLEQSAEQRIQTLKDALCAADPALACWAPLFGILVEADMSDTSETSALEPQFRPKRLAEVVSEVLVRAVRTPMLVTIEDTHWMDDASADLLRAVADSATNVALLICTTRRRDETGYRAPADRSVTLEPLSDADAIRLVEVATESHPLSPHATSALVARAGGNPLYLTELLAAVGTSEVGALPDSVEALITARIDRLAPEDRRILRQASVLGRTFPIAWIEALVGCSAEELWQRLGSFVRPEASGLAGFEHALIRDAAYEGLPFRLRRQLHAEAAEIIDEYSRRFGEDRAGLLSLHHLHAERYADAWTQALQAARQAQVVYANVEAAELYERAIGAAKRLSDLDPSELSSAQESLGDVRERFGAYPEAEEAYRLARRLAGADPLGKARLQHKIAFVQGWRDQYQQALATLSRGLRFLEGTDSVEALRLRARLLAAYASFCEMEGDHRRTVKWCRQAIAAAESADEKEAMANALRMLDWALAQVGTLESPDNLLRALAIYEELGDLPGQANALNMLGGLAYWRGDWSGALTHYRQAQDIATRTGNTVLAALFGANIAEILLDQGRIDLAASLLGDASRVTQAAGSRSGTAFALCNLGRLASRQGLHDQAVMLLDRAIADAEEVGRMHEALEGRARKAECLLVSGQVEDALVLATATLESTRAQGGAPQSPLLYRLCAVANARLGDLEAAGAAFAASLVTARERGADYEIALSLLAQTTMVERLDQVAPAEWETDGKEILTRLGVVSIPPLYG